MTPGEVSVSDPIHWSVPLPISRLFLFFFFFCLSSMLSAPFGELPGVVSERRSAEFLGGRRLAGIAAQGQAARNNEESITVGQM